MNGSAFIGRPIWKCSLVESKSMNADIVPQFVK